MTVPTSTAQNQNGKMRKNGTQRKIVRLGQAPAFGNGLLDSDDA
jgi:hypothetical protein